MRVRSAQAVRGVAQPRSNAIRPNPPRSYDPWYRWSPWYGYGYGYPYSYGHVAYNPWVYGGAWSWSRYRWHDPFLFDPYGYVGVPYYWPSSSTGWDDDRDQGAPAGSVRLRVTPGHARVYVNGALAGVASEFAGLTDHLTLPAGTHEVELRADGYASYTSQIEVRDGRTRTERVNLKKQ